MGKVRAETTVELPAARAEALWTDLRRWPSFIEGFARVVDVDSAWPEPNTKLVWESKPSGRGRVTERVRDRRSGLIVSAVYEDRLTGVQRVSFDGDRVELELDYELTKGLRIVDFLFTRRLLRESLERTLARFAIEAAEEARL